MNKAPGVPTPVQTALDSFANALRRLTANLHYVSQKPCANLLPG
jgi:hypothetical protein